MSEPIAPTPLQSHTLETLLDELVSGRPVALDADGETFQLEGAESRSVFAWYREHRDAWSKLVQKDDIEVIVDQLENAAPVLPPRTSSASSQGKRTLFLQTLRAHRFGGIHRYGTLKKPPAEFSFTFEQIVTLIEGANGSGKTSVLSAILWCLTGYTYCPLRPPESAKLAVPVTADNQGGDTGEPRSSWIMSPITPMPPAGVLKSLGDKSLPLDTWVELTFVDEDGNDAGTIRRSMKRGAKETGFDTLGLDPLAREIGTRMPGLLPYIQLGAQSDLGKAVADLIGIKPLQDLAKHASRVQERLKTDFPKERKAEIAELDQDYEKTQKELSELLQLHSALSRACGLPAAAAASAAEDVDGWQKHFEGLQAEALANAKAILGRTFDNNNPTSIQDLIKSIGPALGLLDPVHLGKLESTRRLAELGRLSVNEIAQAEALLKQLQEEARELNALTAQPDWAARVRLYVRVAGWMKEHPGHAHDPMMCPLCLGALEGKLDDITGKQIEEHLRTFMDTDKQFLEKTAVAWEKDAVLQLRAGICPTLQGELDRELPATPAALIKSAFGEELFAAECLKSCLAVLKPAVFSLCEKSEGNLPAFEEPGVPAFAGAFGTAGGKLEQTGRRMVRAIAFAQWRTKNDPACKQAFQSIIGQMGGSGEDQSQRAMCVDAQPLCDSLSTLDQLVNTTEPISNAIARTSSLTETLNKRVKKVDRIDRYARAAAAIEPLLALPTLVEKQVGFLMKTLADATAKWKDMLYSPAFVGAPSAINPEFGAQGIITLDAAAEGTQAPAQHVGNTAELRAALLAFFLAFWEHRLQTHGGLALLLLDDPQELFDRPNRRHMANTIPALTRNGARIIVTTLDTDFGRQVVTACGRDPGQVSLDHRLIHPLKAHRPHIVLGRFVEDVEAKRRTFEDPENENEAQPARDYLNVLRIFLDDRLLDFFDTPAPGLPTLSTLADLVNAVRSRVNLGTEPFADPAFRNLVDDPAMAQGSELLRLLNQSHHGNQNQIQYADVVKVKDHCIQVLRLVAMAHEAYERWLRRDPRDAVPAAPDPPSVISFPKFEVALYENLAAFTSDAAPGEAVVSGERFCSDRFSNHALYVVCSNNFGFAGPMNCRAIVDLPGASIVDNSLVIALHGERVYARRLHLDLSKPGLLALGSDAIDPKKRPPSVILPAEQVQLLKVVGILFDDRPHFPHSKEEAVLATDLSRLREVEIAFRVEGTSAEPLALSGQTILGGRSLTPDEFASMVGSLVAVSASDEAVFKRIGDAIPGKKAKHVRQLEAIGGLGSSMLIRTHEPKDDPYSAVSLVQSARLVLGVLYE